MTADLEIFAEIDLNLMISFLMVYKERNLSQAARKLGTDQEALGRKLIRLQAHFKDALFENAGHHLQATAKAHCIVDELVRGLNLIQ
jgi:DNA-binding transcriptional LysR family regulator